jgi:hypothetical protein
VRAASFADVLDEALRLAVPDAGDFAGAGPATPPARPYVAHPFLFARPLTASMPRWLWLSQPETPPVRPDHPLTDHQRQALDRLVDLGASLAANFTAAELRREYRLLAFRYHPDRHAGAGELERTSLARAFAATTTDYRSLRAVVEPRH